MLAAVLLASLGLAALAFVLVPPAVAPTAAVAVYAASLATAGFLLNGRQALVDRSDLRAEVKVEYWGPPSADNKVVQVRFYNAGRRPVRVEEAGMWADKSRTVRLPSWVAWGKDKEPPLPKTLPEGDSHVIYTWPRLVAHWYVKHEPVTLLYAKPAHGETRWWALPEEVRSLIADDWPAAREAYRKEVEAEAQKPGDEGEYGQPLRPPGQHDQG